MNPFDKALAYIAPGLALKREQSRRALAFYEAVKPSRYRKGKVERGSGDAAVSRGGAGVSLREQARHLDQNHDLSVGLLDALVQNVVGPAGIQVEPQPRSVTDSTIHEGVAQQLLNFLRDWQKRPEVTWGHDWAGAQRIVARTWLRDGEVFAQRLLGDVPSLVHGTQIPYSLELLESDFVPFDYEDAQSNVRMGIQRNAWNRPTAYYVFKKHPGDNLYLPTRDDLKVIPAERMLHLKFTNRIGQARGASIFASVLNRLDSIKDYEESEQVAAKVAASMAAYIIKGGTDHYSPDYHGGDAERDMHFRAGMIFDDLQPGESVGTIDTNRPNTSLEAHRKGQLRAVASGTRVTYSSLSRDYNGSYSSQRQELVEGYGAYGVLSSEMISGFVRPVYEDFVQAALLSRQLDIPSDVQRETLNDALYITPQMPWIDPWKEAKAMESLERNIHASGPEIIRRRGQNPRDVLEQEANWRKALLAHELISDSDPRHDYEEPFDEDK